MNSQKKAIIASILCCSFVLTPLAGKASILSLVGGDDTQVLPGDWNPFPIISDLSIGNSITVFDAAAASAGEGIYLNADADLTYTYEGKEAGSTNASSTSISDRFFITGSTAPGTTFETSGTAGLLDFSFEGLGTCCVAPGIFTNGIGSTNAALSLAVAIIDSSSMYLMFGDGYGDADFDDMVVKIEAVSRVPVPATVWLFGTALIGLIGFTKSRKVS